MVTRCKHWRRKVSTKTTITKKNCKIEVSKDYPWKVLGFLVDDLRSYIDKDDYDLVKGIIRDRDFNSYLALSNIWNLQNFNQEVCSKMYNYSRQAALYQISSLLKKFLFPSVDQERKKAAFIKFQQAEVACKEYNNVGFKQLVANGAYAANLLSYARGFLLNLLGNTCPTKEILTRWSRHGPGSSLDTRNGNSNIYFKYTNWPYSCTNTALPYARFLIQSDRRWLGALEDSYRSRNGIPKHHILNQKVFWESVFKVVEGNRIAFVPKNAQVDRSIAVEPTMNLMLQLGVDGYIRNRLKRYGIDLDSQYKNQLLARRGSKDDSYVTLDLASASDTISLRICKLLLPDEWYQYLMNLRSPKGVINGESFSYEKISSMGCGFTFVLESAIFAAIIFATNKINGSNFDFNNDFAVFGDDLIVPKTLASPVLNNLKLAGFSINSDKSFFYGPIRESCGTDWTHGLPLRPIFLSELPSSIFDIFVDHNRLQRNLEIRFSMQESKTCQYIRSCIPPKFKEIQGPYSDFEFDSYLHTKSFGTWNNSLWRFPILVKLPVKLRADQFFFRKLMHDLRTIPVHDQYVPKWKQKITLGNRFTVNKSYTYTVRKSSSISNNWRREYVEHLPLLA